MEETPANHAPSVRQAWFQNTNHLDRVFMVDSESIETHRPPTSLRKIVQQRTEQDLRRCRGCAVCNIDGIDNQDVTLDMLVQMVLWNDEELLTTRTLWSDEVLAEARYACTRGINLQAVLLVLREIAEQRGYSPPLD